MKMRAQLDDLAVATATTASSTGLEAKEVVVEEEEEKDLVADSPLPCNPVNTLSPLLDMSEGGLFVDDVRPSVMLFPKKDMLALNCGWYGLVMSNLSDTSSRSGESAADASGLLFRLLRDEALAVVVDNCASPPLLSRPRRSTLKMSASNAERGPRPLLLLIRSLANSLSSDGLPLC